MVRAQMLVYLVRATGTGSSPPTHPWETARGAANRVDTSEPSHGPVALPIVWMRALGADSVRCVPVAGRRPPVSRSPCSWIWCVACASRARAMHARTVANDCL